MSARHDGLIYAGKSDVGLVRSGNEDSYLLNPPLFAVADGLGGHSAGEVASRVAVETLGVMAPSRLDVKALARAIRQANTDVIRAAETGQGRSGMGTTITAAMVDGPNIIVAHVGDSRAYLLHLGHLQQITDDHSLVADMVRNGQLTEDEARYHPNRSVITRALGSDPNLIVDTFEVEATPGDRLLLCSDGLTTMLTDPEIEQILATSPSPSNAVDRLVARANDEGGHDNITAVVVSIGEGTGRRRALSGTRAATPAAEREPRHRLGRILWALALLAAVGGAAWGAYAYAQSQAFLIAENGHVAVYQGVPGDFAGISLRWHSEDTTIQIDDLDLVTAARLKTGLRVADLSAAQELVRQYRERLDASGTPDSAETTTTP